MASFTKVANGNIAPARFVKMDTTADGKVLQAGAGDPIYGIAQPGTRNTPYSTLDDGYAAIAGENLCIYGDPGDKCMLQVGAAVTRGQRLKSDANGKGIPTTADGDEYGAIAQMSGTTDQLIQAEVMLGQRGA